jgi:hypothetical protein
MLALRIGAIFISLGVFAAPAVAQDGDGMAPGAILAATKTPPSEGGTANSGSQAHPAHYGGYRYSSYRYGGYRYYGYGSYKSYSAYRTYSSRSDRKPDLDNVEPGSIVVRSEALSGPAQGPRLLQPQ